MMPQFGNLFNNKAYYNVVCSVIGKSVYSGLGSLAAEQSVEIIVMLSTGIALALLLDVYRALRSLWKPGQLGSIIGDIVYSFAATITIALVLLYTSWGAWRLYYCLFWGLGILLYRLLMRYRIVIVTRGILRRVFASIDWLLTFAAKCFSFVGAIITYPVLLTYRLIRILGNAASFLITKPFSLLRRR